MAPKRVEAFDTTIQKTNAWLREIAEALGSDNRRHAYLALRGTLHALRAFLPLNESAQLAAQLPMLVRGLYFEGWNPAIAPEPDRSRERFLSWVATELEHAMWNEAHPIAPEAAARAVLRVLADHISAGEWEQARHVLPERVRDLWPTPSTATSTRPHEPTERSKESAMEQDEAKRRSERVTGVSNVAYDLMVVLTNTLEGVAAMEEYKLDAAAAGDEAVRAAFDRIEQRARQDIDELRGLLSERLQQIQRVHRG